MGAEGSSSNPPSTVVANPWRLATRCSHSRPTSWSGRRPANTGPTVRRGPLRTANTRASRSERKRCRSSRGSAGVPADDVLGRVLPSPSGSPVVDPAEAPTGAHPRAALVGAGGAPEIASVTGLLIVGAAQTPATCVRAAARLRAPGSAELAMAQRLRIVAVAETAAPGPSHPSMEHAGFDRSAIRSRLAPGIPVIAGMG